MEGSLILWRNVGADEAKTCELGPEASTSRDLRYVHIRVYGVNMTAQHFLSQDELKRISRITQICIGKNNYGVIGKIVSEPWASEINPG